MYMKKIIFVIFVLFLSVASIAQGLQSPEQYLGYKIGTRYTRHHKIVEYYRAVAQAKPEMLVNYQLY